MSRRQNHSSGDSFDLFLDTICNTFGGVVFLAILVALLAKTRHDPSSQPAGPQIDAASLREMRSELDQQTQRLREVEMVLDAVPQPTFDPSLTELVELSDEMSQLKDEARERSGQRDRMGKQLVTVAAASLELDKSIDEATGLVKDAQQRLESSRTAWKSTLASTGQTLQVPVQRHGAGASAMIALSGGELFLISSPDDGPGEFFERHVVATQIDLNDWTVTLRTGKGLMLGGPKSAAAVAGTAKRLSSSETTLIIIAYPDSYHQFASVRDAFKLTGMNYELWIKAEGDPIEFSYGRGANRVQ